MSSLPAKLLPDAGPAAAEAVNTPDGQGLQLWRKLTQLNDPVLEGNFVGESMKRMRHEPVGLEQLSVVIPAWEAEVTALKRSQRTSGSRG